MATDYEYSDDFTSAQYLLPGRGPFLIEYNPPPLPPQQLFLQRLVHLAIPPHTARYIPGFVLGFFILAFFQHCSVLVSDCWQRCGRIRSVVNPVVYALFAYALGKGMWDVAMLKSELKEARRQLWQVQENLVQYLWTSPPPAKTPITITWIHDGE